MLYNYRQDRCAEGCETNQSVMTFLSEKIPSTNLKRTLHMVRVFAKILFKNMEGKLGRSATSDELAHYLKTHLGTLKGPLMKVGQILATVPGVLPSAYAEAFLTLSNQAPPMGPLFVKRRMIKELGLEWRDLFKQFQMTPTFAASLGQIHKAEIDEGGAVAVKLQYPDMRHVVETDLKYLRLLCRVYERYGKALMTQNLQDELKERLLEELDYTLEAQHILWFQKALENEKGVVVPQVYLKLSTNKVLTMSWLAGESLLHFTTAETALREQIAKRLFRAWWNPFYTMGLLHGDPHLGNYTVNTQTHELNILDFGCVRVFDSTVVEGMIRLFKGLKENNSSLIQKAYAQIGFKQTSQEVIEVLNMWARFLYEPLLYDEERFITNDRSGTQGRRLAEEVHRLLSRQGGVMPPREFVFLDRAAVGIGAALMRLNVKMNWHQLFMELVKDFHPKKLKEKQKSMKSKA